MIESGQLPKTELRQCRDSLDTFTEEMNFLHFVQGGKKKHLGTLLVAHL